MNYNWFMPANPSNLSILKAIFLLSIIALSICESRSESINTQSDWRLHIEKAYEAVQEDNRDGAMAALHFALNNIEASSSESAAIVLKEMVNVYRKFGQEEQATTIGNLLLTPAYTPQMSSILKAHRIAVRKKAILAAADTATANRDYLLADALYSSLLPSPSFYARIINRDQHSDDYEFTVVDRLTRLYLAHGDFDRAENLIRKTRQMERLIRRGEARSEANQKKLAMLDIDQALLEMKRGRHKQAARRFEKSSIKLERLLSRNQDKAPLVTIYGDYALCLAKMKRNSEADRYFRRALKIAEDCPSVQKSTLRTIEANYLAFSRTKQERKKAPTSKSPASKEIDGLVPHKGDNIEPLEKP